MEEKKDGEVRMSERRAQLTCQLTVYHCIDTSHVAVGPPGHLKNVDPGRLVGSDVTGHILCSHGSRLIDKSCSSKNCTIPIEDTILSRLRTSQNGGQLVQQSGIQNKRFLFFLCAGYNTYPGVLLEETRRDATL
ncbi:uncharacterized protein LOC135162355 isoform X1 [Diachasmimorpha longicaudata]|uniref:uncharacterized protein LOC135162355 isoform X1 n=1 Tax=Diachasmimorpha longicaudata TaxID=58733 RepID=UPI0030B8A199